MDLPKVIGEVAEPVC